MLRQIGLEAERVKMYNMPSTMETRFVEAVIDITEQITKRIRLHFSDLHDEIKPH